MHVHAKWFGAHVQLSHASDNQSDAFPRLMHDMSLPSLAHAWLCMLGYEVCMQNMVAPNGLAPMYKHYKLALIELALGLACLTRGFPLTCMLDTSLLSCLHV